MTIQKLNEITQSLVMIFRVIEPHIKKDELHRLSTTFVLIAIGDVVKAEGLDKTLDDMNLSPDPMGFERLVRIINEKVDNFDKKFFKRLKINLDDYLRSLNSRYSKEQLQKILQRIEHILAGIDISQ